jgi:glycosyltransferase involved in cell wall biosynthesis
LDNVRPVRVLHIIDGLGGGGAERLLWDIVRLSDPQQVLHQVVTAFPDDGSFVYSKRLRRAGAYNQDGAGGDDVADDAVRSLTAPTQNASTSRWNRPFSAFWDAAKSVRKRAHDALVSENSQHEVIPRPLSSAGESNRSMDSSDDTRGEPSDAAVTKAKAYEFITDAEGVAATQSVMKAYLNFRPDVIHGHTFHGFALGLFLKLVFHRPFLFSVPCLFSQLENAGVGYIPEQYRRFHAGVDCFFTAYPAELLEIGVPAERILSGPGAVDLQAISQIRSERELHRIEICRTYGVAENALIALSVGRFHPSKGHQYALAALPRLVEVFPNLQWLVIGGGRDQERMALETRAAELGVSQHVHAIGFVEDPLPFYAAADVYLRTPVFEGDNLSSYQAMALGLPVVGFKTERETELIDTVGHGILVPPRDAAALAEAVQEILLTPDRGREMGSRGSEYCRLHLDLRSLINRLVTAYSDLRNLTTEPSEKRC